MAKKVIKIPATLDQYSLLPKTALRKRNVAGYARVSTDYEEQATSYETQMEYYKSYISRNPEWNFVGMYSDEGISGTRIKYREGFQRMIKDALDGKIDLIITKSISRFARNTVDTLVTVRSLKDKGVEIYFEKENIWTLDTKGELLITIMSSLAQEESRSISENVKWGKRKQFAMGKTSVGYSAFLGYDKDFVINEEQAEVVKLIYKLFLSGYSVKGIADELEKRNIKTALGGSVWYSSTVKSILTNEKYKGDALIQKDYSVDFLDKKRRVNKGEIPQYYVKEHHEPIISPKVFELVQAEINMPTRRPWSSGNAFFSNKIKCACCGGWYGRKVWHSNEPEKKKYVLQCNKKYAVKGKVCPSSTLSENDVKDMFRDVLTKLLETRKGIMENIKMLIHTVSDTSALEHEKAELMASMNEIAVSIKTAIHSISMCDYNFDTAKEDALRQKYNEAFLRCDEIGREVENRNNRRIILQAFLERIEKLDGDRLEFSEELWCSLIDHILIGKDKKATFVLRGGIKIQVQKSKKKR